MENNLKKTVYFFLITASAVGICYIFSHFGKSVLSVILPFITAMLCAYMLRGPADYLENTLKMPKWAVCIFLVSTFYSALFTFAYLVISRLFREISGLSNHLSALENEIPMYIAKAEDFLQDKLPLNIFSEYSGKSLGEMAISMISQLTQRLAEAVGKALPSALGTIPNLLIFAAVTVLATFYFTADLHKINRFILYQLPTKAKILLSEFRIQFFDTASKYIGAYTAIAAITFTELFTGLLFIRREYAFVLAIFITLIDILPFFGSGFILLPWAIWEFFFASAQTALKLLVLYLIITVIRQIIEPKILGSFIGLPPLVTLFSIYAGVKLVGIAGIFLFPVLAIVIKNLNEKKMLPFYRVPPYDHAEKLSETRKKYKKFKKNAN